MRLELRRFEPVSAAPRASIVSVRHRLYASSTSSFSIRHAETGAVQATSPEWCFGDEGEGHQALEGELHRVALRVCAAGESFHFAEAFDGGDEDLLGREEGVVPDPAGSSAAWNAAALGVAHHQNVGDFKAQHRERYCRAGAVMGSVDLIRRQRWRRRFG